MQHLWGRGYLSEVKGSLGVGGPCGVPMPRSCPTRDCGSCCGLSSTVTPLWRPRSGGTRWGGTGGSQGSGAVWWEQRVRGDPWVWKIPGSLEGPRFWVETRRVGGCPGAWGDPDILGETEVWGDPRGWGGPRDLGREVGLGRCNGWGRNQGFGWTWGFGRDAHVWGQLGIRRTPPTCVIPLPGVPLPSCGHSFGGAAGT